MIKDLILQNRSCRRFYQDVAVDHKTLRGLVDLARCSASAANRQPLKYIISTDAEKNAVIFKHLSWASVLGWEGPPEGERPAAYIIILLDTQLSEKIRCDQGIAAQSILLGARDIGLGGVMHGAMKRKEMYEALGISSRYQIELVISLGKPKEKGVIEAMKDGDFKYWRDSEGILHVPKRLLNDIIVNEW